MIAAEELSLAEVEIEVGRRLRDLGLAEAQADGRVADVPDARTVRYYGTLGLVDRPRIVDRQARYGRRHVLQLVAIKALQAAGLPLAEVQSRLYGLGNAELEALLKTAAAPVRPAPAPVLWREVVIEPGLKVMADERWAPGEDPAALERKVRAALAALNKGGRR